MTDGSISILGLFPDILWGGGAMLSFEDYGPFVLWLTVGFLILGVFPDILWGGRAMFSFRDYILYGCYFFLGGGSYV